jgi:hypothetical protein
MGEHFDLGDIAIVRVGGVDVCVDCLTDERVKKVSEFFTKQGLIEAPDGTPIYTHLYCNKCGKMFGRFSQQEEEEVTT